MSEHALVGGAEALLARVCGKRDEAVGLAVEAVEMLQRAHGLMVRAAAAAQEASAGEVYSPRDRRAESAYRALFQEVDPDASRRAFVHATDAAVWIHLLDATGMRKLMDATELQAFYDQLAGDEVAPVTEDNVIATLRRLHGDSRAIFLRGLARAFMALDKRFRSHDAFKIGSRLIFRNVFNEWGSWSFYSAATAQIADVERVFAVLDGEEPKPGELREAVEQQRGHRHGPRQGYVETRYFRIRSFKNGNAHLWFTRDDLVERANLLLAEYYGEVLPDAVPKEAPPEKCTALSRDLAFYATPDAVCTELLRDTWLDGARVLEPSAGTGNIVRAVLARGESQARDAGRRRASFTAPVVEAVEVHPGRAAQLRASWGVPVTVANFLQLRPRPVYTLIVMNPPFVGTHWMDHVMHAWEFLAPNGVLLAVLPVTAEMGDSAKHKRFRAWVQECRGERGYKRTWRDLPQESFVESGTRVNTVILRMQRGS